ncbi:MAG: hypothetical protein HC841_09030 [Verrucomicrobiae bacterium]|nr:hypothetical protein [Verrucomicrobiae bacterium]
MRGGGREEIGHRRQGHIQRGAVAGACKEILPLDFLVTNEFEDFLPGTVVGPAFVDLPVPKLIPILIFLAQIGHVHIRQIGVFPVIRPTDNMDFFGRLLVIGFLEGRHLGLQGGQVVFDLRQPAHGLDVGEGFLPPGMLEVERVDAVAARGAAAQMEQAGDRIEGGVGEVVTALQQFLESAPSVVNNNVIRVEAQDVFLPGAVQFDVVEQIHPVVDVGHGFIL